MNKKEQLSEEEIKDILDSYEKRQKEKCIVEMYKENCPNFKDKKCAGSVSMDCRSGCNLCIKEKTYDLNNAEPVMGTEEYSEFSKQRAITFLDAVANCNLAFDDKFCKYKDVFNYCFHCKKEFRRKER